MFDYSFILTIASETNKQAALIGVLSSGFAYWANQRTTRKKQQSDLIQEIERLATMHWCSDGGDENNNNRALEIQTRIQDLSWKARYKRLLITFWKIKIDKIVVDEFIDFRKAITSDDFSEVSRNRVPFESDKVRLINNAAKDLRKKLNLKEHH